MFSFEVNWNIDQKPHAETFDRFCDTLQISQALSLPTTCESFRIVGTRWHKHMKVDLGHATSHCLDEHPSPYFMKGFGLTNGAR